MVCYSLVQEKTMQKESGVVTCVLNRISIRFKQFESMKSFILTSDYLLFEKVRKIATARESNPGLREYTDQLRMTASTIFGSPVPLTQLNFTSAYLLPNWLAANFDVSIAFLTLRSGPYSRPPQRRDITQRRRCLATSGRNKCKNGARRALPPLRPSLVALHCTASATAAKAHR